MIDDTGQKVLHNPWWRRGARSPVSPVLSRIVATTLLLVVAVAALQVAACGDDDEPSAASTQESSSECPEPCAGFERCCEGICVDIAFDVDHCGACGNACDPGSACNGGSCRRQDCRTDELFCEGACVPRDDPEHCGQCFRECGSDEVCDDGQCRATGDCAQGEALCGGTCTPLGNDDHCSDCFDACFLGQACINNACQVIEEGTTDSSNAGGADTTTDAPGSPRPSEPTDGEGESGEGSSTDSGDGEGGSESQESSECAEGERVCAGRCVDSETDSAHCGGCGVVCATTAACVAGECAAVCEDVEAAREPGCFDVRYFPSTEEIRQAWHDERGWLISTSAGLLRVDDAFGDGSGDGTGDGAFGDGLAYARRGGLGGVVDDRFGERAGLLTYPAVPALEPSVVAAMRDRRARLWLGTESGELLVGNQGFWTAFDVPALLDVQTGAVDVLVESPDGLIFAAMGADLLIVDAALVEAGESVSADAMVVRSAGELFASADESAAIRAITFDAGGRAILAGTGVLHRLSDPEGEADALVMPGAEPGEQEFRVARYCAGTLWANVSNGLRALVGSAWLAYSEEDVAGATGEALAMTCSRLGVLWLTLAQTTDVLRLTVQGEARVAGPGGGETIGVRASSEGLEVVTRPRVTPDGDGATTGAPTRQVIPIGLDAWEDRALATDRVPADPHGWIDVVLGGTPLASGADMTVTLDDGSWAPLAQPAREELRDIRSSHPKSDRHFFGTSRGAFRSFDGTRTAGGPVPGAGSIDAMAPNPHGWATGDASTFYFASTLDDGVSQLWSVPIATDRSPDSSSAERIDQDIDDWPLQGERIVAMLTTDDDEIWVATANAGILRLQADREAHVQPRDMEQLHDRAADSGLISDEVRALALADDGGIWVATRTALQLYRDGWVGTWDATEDVDLPGAEVRAIAPDDSGALWIAMSPHADDATADAPGGLVRFDGEAFVTFDRRSGSFPDNRVSGVAAGSGGVAHARIPGGIIRVSAP